MAQSLKKLTTADIRTMYQTRDPITMITAYDASQAALVQAAGIDVILVGDSLGMVMLGYDTTIPVTVDDMVHHAKAVRRGAPDTMMIVDMPFLSYHQAVFDTVRQAGVIMQQAQADAVKLEGGVKIAQHVSALVDAGIPVCGHLGLTPQSVLNFGGFYVQAKEQETAEKLLEDARAIEQAGAFMIVLECIPSQLAKIVSQVLNIPTIGIGAGSGCAGQVLVYHDVLGLNSGKRPKFVKQYANLQAPIIDAIKTYRDEVKGQAFPTPEFSYDISHRALSALEEKVEASELAPVDHDPLDEER